MINPVKITHCYHYKSKTDALLVAVNNSAKRHEYIIPYPHMTRGYGIPANRFQYCHAINAF